MRWSTAATLLFVFYCVEVGVFFLIAPWGTSWDRAVINLPFPALHDIYLKSTFRGALSGFGLIHIVWGAHDLELWLARRQKARDKKLPGGVQG
jgi:hypothetical protein